MTMPTSNTESKTDLMPTPPGLNTKPVEAALVEKETHDELGYELDKPVEAPAVKPVEEPAKPVETPATGYGKPPVETPAPAVKPVEEPAKTPEEMTDEEKSKKEITDTIKEMGLGYDKEKITKFALENKLTKPQLDAYVKLTKDEDTAFLKQQEDAKLAQRKSWNDELLKDPEFGGESFDKNIDRVEKLLQNYMPNIKKVLTEKGGMLPPYIMRDFLSLAKALNPTATLVSGEPATPPEEAGNFLDNLYV